jgi:hypothetical protein
MESPEVGSARDLAKTFSNRNLPPQDEVSLLWRALNLVEPEPPQYPQPLPIGNKLSLYGSCQGDTRNRTCSLRAIDYS